MKRHTELQPCYKTLNFTTSQGNLERICGSVLTQENVAAARYNIIDPTYRWLYVLEGRGRMINDQEGSEFELTPGSLYIRRPGVSHSIIRDFSTPWKEFCLLITGIAYTNLLNLDLINPDHEYFHLLPTPHIYRQLTDFLESFSPHPQNPTMCQVVSSLMPLLTLLYNQTQSAAAPERALQQKNEYIVQQAITTLNNNFETEADYQKIAAESGYSLDHFRRIFRNSTGQTLKSFRLEAKMQYAAILIRNTDMTLEHISSLLGYSDRFVFTHQYRRFHQIPPATDRKNISASKIT